MAETTPSTTEPLPTLTTAMHADEVRTQAATLSRRGKLAGYQPGRGGELFRADAFGNPFDADLICTASQNSENKSENQTTLSFETKLKPKMPAIAIVLIVVSIWPGVWLTDSMLSIYFVFYGGWTTKMPWLTYAWYLPLTVVPLPWVCIGLMKKTRAAIHEHALEQIEKIAKAVDAS